MSRSQSELEALTKLRTRARDAQRARVADAVQAEAALDTQLEEIDREVTAMREKQRQSRGGAINARTVLEIERYEMLLKTNAIEIHRQKQTIRQELERRMSDLAVAEQQLKAVEKLEERRRQRFQQAAEKKEQRELDEIATQLFLRRSGHQSTGIPCSVDN